MNRFAFLCSNCRASSQEFHAEAAAILLPFTLPTDVPKTVAVVLVRFFKLDLPLISIFGQPKGLHQVELWSNRALLPTALRVAFGLYFRWALLHAARASVLPVL